METTINEDQMNTSHVQLELANHDVGMGAANGIMDLCGVLSFKNPKGACNFTKSVCTFINR